MPCQVRPARYAEQAAPLCSGNVPVAASQPAMRRGCTGLPALRNWVRGPPLTSRPGAWGGGLMGGLHGTELCPHVCPHDHAARSQHCPHAPSPDQRKPHSGWSCQGSRGRSGASRASWDGNETAGALRSQPPRTQQEGAPASPGKHARRRTVAHTHPPVSGASRPRGLRDPRVCGARTRLRL